MRAPLYPITFCLAAMTVATFAATAPARTTTVSAGIGVTQSYDSNVDRTNSNETSQWETALRPNLTIVSQAQHDSVQLTYSPGLRRNQRTHEKNVDQFVSLTAAKNFSSTFSMDLFDTFERTDDSLDNRLTAQDPTTRINLSENRARARYWTNIIGIGSTYTYAQNSTIGFHYSHSILTHSAAGQDDYQRHTPAVTWRHWFNRQWLLASSLSFTKGMFDLSPDTKTTSETVRLQRQFSPHKSFFGELAFDQTDYAAGNRDYQTSSANIGGAIAFDQRTSMNMTTGISHSSNDNRPDENAFSLNATLQRTLSANSSLTVNGASGFEDQNFNGQTDGQSKFWSAGAVLTGQPLQDVNVNGFITYRRDDYQEQQGRGAENRTESGISVAYTFWRWYTASLRYAFLTVSSDLAANEYDDHRLFFTLAANWEILHN